MTHIAYTFPECVSYGAFGGPEFLSTAYESDNGDRSVFVPWPIGRHRYNAQSGIKDISDFEAVLTAFHVAQGKAHTFDWKDWNDYKSSAINTDVTNLDQSLGTGDNVETDFPVYKDYTIGSITRQRPIQRLKSGTIVIAGDGTPITTGWSWVANEFLIRFDVAPASSVVLTIGYEFYVPVAFSNNYFDTTLINKVGDELVVSFPIELEEVKLKTTDIV